MDVLQTLPLLTNTYSTRGGYCNLNKMHLVYYDAATSLHIRCNVGSFLLKQTERSTVVIWCNNTGNHYVNKLKKQTNKQKLLQNK